MIVDNDGVIEELLGEVLKAARFNKPLRPAYLYRPRAAHDLAEVPEFYQQYVPALPDDCYSAFDMTLEQVAKRQIFMEEKNLKKGELDSSNRFCDVALLRNHIEKVDELAEILQAWAQENDVSLKNDFLAGWVAAYVRPGHSNVYFKKNMDVSNSEEPTTVHPALMAVILLSEY